MKKAQVFLMNAAIVLGFVFIAIPIVAARFIAFLFETIGMLLLTHVAFLISWKYDTEALADWADAVKQSFTDTYQTHHL